MDNLNNVMYTVKQMFGGYSDNVYQDLENRLKTLGLDSQQVKVVEVKKEIYVQKKHQRINIKWWATDWLNKNNLTIDDLLNRARKTENVKSRHRFCIDAFKEGYTVAAIARFLNLKSGSIYNGIRKIIE